MGRLAACHPQSGGGKDGDTSDARELDAKAAAAAALGESRVLLFGGSTAAAPLNDLCVLRGLRAGPSATGGSAAAGTWVALEAAGAAPSARSGHALAGALSARFLPRLPCRMCMSGILLDSVAFSGNTPPPHPGTLNFISWTKICRKQNWPRSDNGMSGSPIANRSHRPSLLYPGVLAGGRNPLCVPRTVSTLNS